MLYGGRGGAKSWGIARALLLMGANRQLRILCAREIQKNIEESVHQLLADQIAALELGGFYEVQRAKIIGKNGTTFSYAGLKHNAAGLKSHEGCDICWVEEAHAVSAHSWDILIPTIRKDGSEIWISYNPELEEDETHQRFVVNPPADAEIIEINWRDNPWFPAVLDQERQTSLARVAAGLKSQADHDHTWEGKCRKALEGAIYGRELEWLHANNRITEVPHVVGIPIFTFWDIGRNDTTAIWFMQRIGMTNRFFDFYEDRLQNLSFYIGKLREFAMTKGYQFGRHYLPHDVEVTDISREDCKSRKEVLEDARIGEIHTVPRVDDLREGIDVTRRAFSGCWFDKDGCKNGLHALRHYVREYDEKHQVYRQTPLHNWASNAADAFRQFGQGFVGDDGSGQGMNGWRKGKSKRSAMTV